MAFQNASRKTSEKPKHDGATRRSCISGGKGLEPGDASPALLNHRWHSLFEFLDEVLVYLQTEVLHGGILVGKHDGGGVVRKLAFGLGVAEKRTYK